MSMLGILSDMPEPLINGLAQGGVLAVIIGALLWRDAKRDLKRDERDMRRDDEVGKLTGAIHSLTRAITLEVLTRPNVVKRAEDEAREIHQSVSAEDR